ncbi:MAG: cytochrome c [Rhizorhabdus sp.]
MRSTTATFALGTGIVALAACTTPAAAPSPLAAGYELAQARCARCHAIELTGASPRPQAPAFRDLYKRYPVEGLRTAFTEGIRVAHPMPQFRLAAADIERLLAYLKSLNPCARPSSDRAAMERCFAPL